MLSVERSGVMTCHSARGLRAARAVRSEMATARARESVRFTSTLAGHLHVHGSPVDIVSYDRAANTIRVAEADEWTGEVAERDIDDLRDFEHSVIERCLHPAFSAADAAEKTTEIKEAS